MLKIKSIFILMLCFTILSCDPQSCRDCEAFNFDLSNWSLIDESLRPNLTFLDEQSNEIHFSLIETSQSEPYRECQLAGSPESVSCFFNRSSTYLVEELGFQMRFFYDQFEVPGDNPAVNDVFYKIQLIQPDEGSIIEAVNLDIYHEEALHIVTTEVEQISQSGESYNDLIEFQIDRMFDVETREEVENQLISSVTFQVPNGIVGFTLTDSTRLILKEE